jgi:Tfp pilus assembly protein PilN
MTVPAAAETETVTRTRVEWAPVPKVNLLPPEILESRRFARTQRLLACAVAGTVLLGAAGVVWAQAGVTSAQEELEVTRAETAVLTAQQAKYADVPRILEQVRVAHAARAQALGQDVLWYRILTDLAGSTPPEASLTNLTLTLASPGTPAAAAAAGADPLTPPGIGDVTFAGKATTFPTVARWLEAVAKVRGFDGSTLRTATRAEGEGEAAALTWTSSIRVTSDALSHRYDLKGS